ncbi:helix-turn-helix domain-containing protein [Kitasatospora hibisci]|uniref:helix-turn-helix domain-containing protein n=1 Tax=Kitasatospora hibisci TaxID=3369522 RepID=UPI003754743A
MTTARMAYKYRAHPDSGQAAVLRRTVGCVRLVWNGTLSDRRARHVGTRGSASYEEPEAVR